MADLLFVTHILNTHSIELNWINLLNRSIISYGSHFSVFIIDLIHRMPFDFRVHSAGQRNRNATHVDRFW